MKKLNFALVFFNFSQFFFFHFIRNHLPCVLLFVIIPSLTVKEYYSKQRGTWGEINPVTRSVPSGKTYNRNKDKQKTGKSAENSVMDLMPILFVIIENVFNRLKMSTNLKKVGCET